MISYDEKDIEDFLWNNPKELSIFSQPITKWIARQYRVPSGIIDLIGSVSFGQERLVVVELKNRKIDSSALTQVCRYAKDIELALRPDDPEAFFIIYKVVIGVGDFDNQTLFEADALGILLYSITGIKASIGNHYSWEKEYRKTIYESYSRIKNDEIFRDFIEEE